MPRYLLLSKLCVASCMVERSLLTIPLSLRHQNFRNFNIIIETD
ncbi:hypothetical protein [Nostoc sp.]